MDWCFGVMRWFTGAVLTGGLAMAQTNPPDVSDVSSSLTGR
jgi:hypothetical protein